MEGWDAERWTGRKDDIKKEERKEKIEKKSERAWNKELDMWKPEVSQKREREGTGDGIKSRTNRGTERFGERANLQT